jgi:peptidoglycan/LPS O-acetylase OafA/YrhL
MRSSNIRYIPEVDHLRAFAATLVDFYHALQIIGTFSRTGNESFDNKWIVTNNPLLALIVEGHSAVTLFLVLSGFIFTYGAAGRDVSYRQFIANRMWRIAPMFFLVVLFGIQIFPEGFTAIGLLQTLCFFGDLPGGIGQGGILLGVTWSVAIEFRCYFVFPFLLHFIERYGLKYVFGVLFVTLLFRCLFYVAHREAGGIAYWTILGRLDQFVIGITAAIVYRKLEGNKRTLRWLLPLAIAGVIGWLQWFNLHGGWPSQDRNRLVWPPVEATVFAFFIVSYVAFDRGSGVPSNWLSSALARLGEISFSTYLLHFAVIWVVVHLHWVPHLSKDPNTNALLTTALIPWPMTIAFATLTYNVVERPFMAYRKRYYVSNDGTARATS